MEKIKMKIRNASLRKSFIYAICSTVTAVVLLSFVTIWSCLAFRKWLLPDSNEVFLNQTIVYEDGTQSRSKLRVKFGDEEQQYPGIFTKNEDGKGVTEPEQKIIKYSVDKIENSYTELTPKRKLAYSITGAAMVGLPMMYSLVGILICAFRFYRKKLDIPIRILMKATENIVNQNLDFSVEYDCEDEMGALCASFDKMREALYENNRKLWGMIEERKMLQASVAHDLRNPIAIIQGYTEYLQLNLSEGRIGKEQMANIASNLSASAKRLERYTNSIRDINHLEELEIVPARNLLPDLLEEIFDDFTIIAKEKGIKVVFENSTPHCKVMIDTQVFYRILENIFSNALRYAKNEISLSFAYENKNLITVVSDDGAGFTKKALHTENRYIYTTEQSEEHMGIGISISRILCRKHGGMLSLANHPPHGAKVTVVIEALTVS